MLHAELKAKSSQPTNLRQTCSHNNAVLESRSYFRQIHLTVLTCTGHSCTLAHNFIIIKTSSDM